MIVSNLSKSYVKKRGFRKKVFENFNIEFPTKGLIYLKGESGSGKSTLLNIISGQDDDYNGDVYFENHNLKDMNAKDRQIYKSKYIGYVYQDKSLFNELNVVENIEFSIRNSGNIIDNNYIDELLNNFNVNHLKDKKVYELSRGEYQRVSIIAALAKKPNILFADEPTSALDDVNTKIIIEQLKVISMNHLVIVVSHKNESIEHVSDMVVNLDEKDNYKEKIDYSLGESEFKGNKNPLGLKYNLFLGLKKLKYDFKRLAFTIILTSLLMVILFTLGMLRNLVDISYTDFFVSLDERLVISVESGSDISSMESQIRMKKYDIDCSYSFPNTYGTGTNYENIRINGIIDSKDVDDELLAGYLPIETNEILITKYFYDFFCKTNLNGRKPANYNEVLQKELGQYIICGIVNIGQDSKYENMDELDINTRTDYYLELVQEADSAMYNSIYGIVPEHSYINCVYIKDDTSYGNLNDIINYVLDTDGFEIVNSSYFYNWSIFHKDFVSHNKTYTYLIIILSIMITINLLLFVMNFLKSNSVKLSYLKKIGFDRRNMIGIVSTYMCSFVIIVVLISIIFIWIGRYPINISLYKQYGYKLLSYI